MPEQVSFPAASAEPMPVMGPTRPRDRIEVLDILRGWAIFGILLVNMMVFAADYLPWAERWPGLVDRTTIYLIQFFAAAKFWTLFSFLFGLGFAIQLERAEARGARMFPVYRRRLFVLLLIGLLHFIVWEGDQLIIYAWLGFVLYLFRNRSPKTLVVAALVFLMVTLGIFSVRTGMRELQKRNPQTAQQAYREAAQRDLERRARKEQGVRVYSEGSFGEVVARHAQLLYQRRTSPYSYLWNLRQEFPLLLLGFFAGRRRLFANLQAHLPFIRKVLRWGLGLGLVCTSVSLVAQELPNPALPFLTKQLGNLLWAIGGPALCFFYASAIVLLAQREAWKRRLAPLAAVGRMALSNYLMQTLTCTTIFYHYGLGFYGKVGPAAGVGLTLLIYGLQIPLSVWWLKHFRFGPVEWLWRTLTYGKLQPVRL